MRKTIYVPSEEVWDGVKSQASEVGLSVSSYLLGRYGVPVELKGLKRGNEIRGGSTYELIERMDRIESKLDELLPFIQPNISPSGKALKSLYDHKPMDVEIGVLKPGVDDSAEIEAANEGLKEKQREAKKLRSSGFFNPTPKAKQVGKKGG